MRGGGWIGLRDDRRLALIGVLVISQSVSQSDIQTNSGVDRWDDSHEPEHSAGCDPHRFEPVRCCAKVELADVVLVTKEDFARAIDFHGLLIGCVLQDCIVYSAC